MRLPGSYTVPGIRFVVDLDEVAANHREIGVHGAHVDVRELDRPHLVVKRVVVGGRVQVWINGELGGVERFVEYEIRGEKHEQAVFVSLTLIASSGDLESQTTQAGA